MSDHEDEELPAIDGLWKVIDWHYKSAEYDEDECLVNWVVNFERNGRVTWKPPSPKHNLFLNQGQNNPLTSYTNYELEADGNLYNYGATEDWVVIRFLDENEGTSLSVPSHVLRECHSNSVVSGMKWHFSLGHIDIVELALERLHETQNIYYDTTFNLLDALEEGYFSDMIIKDEVGEEFAVHSVIVHLSLSTVESSWLQGQSAELLRYVLHHCYGECFPANISLEAGRRCIAALQCSPKEEANRDGGLTLIKQRLLRLLSKMESKERAFCTLNKIENTVESVAMALEDCGLAQNNARLLEMLKQCSGDLLIAASHLLLFCDLLHRGRLHKQERKALLRRAHERIPYYLQLVERVIDALHNLLGSAGQVDKAALSTLLAKDIDGSVLLFDTLTVQLVRWSDGVMHKMSAQKKGVKALKNIKEVLHRTEYNRAKKLYTYFLGELQQWKSHRDTYMSQSSSERSQLVLKLLDFIGQEVTFNKERLHSVKQRGHLERMGQCSWPEFKIFMRKRSAQVAWYLAQLRRMALGEELTRLFQIVLDAVRRPELEVLLKELELIDLAAQNVVPTTTNLPAAYGSSLSTPMHPKDSRLAAFAGKLFNEEANVSVDLKLCCADGAELSAHRVILAARCSWLKRLLQSGMREALEQKIRLPQVSCEALHLFLRFLYCGCIKDGSSMASEVFMELLELADAYEVDGLRAVSQVALINRLDSQSAVPLLALAERLHAQDLRLAALTYVQCHRYELAEEDVEHLSEAVRCLLESSPPQQESSNKNEANDSSVNIEEPVAEQESEQARLLSCLSQLREITGPAPSDDELLDVVRRADCDLNRAVNFYLS